MIVCHALGSNAHRRVPLLSFQTAGGATVKCGMRRGHGRPPFLYDSLITEAVFRRLIIPTSNDIQIDAPVA
jgi:hypothetical protein